MKTFFIISGKRQSCNNLESWFLEGTVQCICPGDVSQHWSDCVVLGGGGGEWWISVIPVSLATPLWGTSRVRPHSVSGPALSQHCRMPAPHPPAVHGQPQGWPWVLSCVVLSAAMWRLHSAGSLWRCVCWGMMYAFPLRTPMPLRCYSRAAKPRNVSPAAAAVGTDLCLSLLSTYCDASLPFLFCLGWAEVALAHALAILGSQPFSSQPQPEVTITPSRALHPNVAHWGSWRGHALVSYCLFSFGTQPLGARPEMSQVQIKCGINHPFPF